MKRTMRYAVGAAAVVLAVAGPATVVVAPAQAATTCAITWGSSAKTAGGSATAGSTAVTGVRGDQHACFDRLVVDLSARAPHACVQYVTQVLNDARGDRVPLRGGAFLHLVLTGVANGSARSGREVVDVSGWQAVRQVAGAGGSEGHAAFGVGTRGRLPFRLFVVPGPGAGSRLVLDVAHSW